MVPRNSVIELSQPTASMSDVKIEYQYTGGGAGGLIKLKHGDIIDLIDDNDEEYPEPIVIEVEDDSPENIVSEERQNFLL